MIAWLQANWSQLLVAIVAIDAALIPLFPKVPIFVTIKNVLSNFFAKPPASS